MFYIRKAALAGIVLAAVCAGWLAKTIAQEKAPPMITYFSRDTVAASFVKAMTSGGRRLMFSRQDSQGRKFSVRTNTRGKSEEGDVHSHEGWVGVVVIMSGSATFNTPGTPVGKPDAPPGGGVLVGPGESHRVTQGDVVIIPPDAPHFYSNIEEPFRYLVIETPL